MGWIQVFQDHRQEPAERKERDRRTKQEQLELTCLIPAKRSIGMQWLKRDFQPCPPFLALCGQTHLHEVFR